LVCLFRLQRRFKQPRILLDRAALLYLTMNNCMAPGRDPEIGLPEEQVPLLSPTPKIFRIDTESCLQTPRPIKHIVLTPRADSTNADIVQFSAPMYFADEDEGSLKVNIIRLGTMQGSLAVNYFTEDSSAMQDVQYEGVAGQLVFEDGEHTKTVEIPILHDDDWTPTCEFKVHLEKAQNCSLGLYLYSCRVKILNCDAFPTDEYAKEIAQGEQAVHNIDDWGLFQEYCKVNYASAGIKWQTAFVLVFDQLNNLIVFGSLWVGVYIVDTLFARDASHKPLLMRNQYHTAVLVGLWFVLPTIVVHVWETLKIHIDIKGASRTFLQKSMLRTYLDYTQQSRSECSPVELNMAINNTAEEVAAAYSAALKIVGLVGKIITVALFVVLYQPDRFAISTVLLLPAVLIVFTCLRVGGSRRAQMLSEERMKTVATLTGEVVQKIRLIADYFKRPMVADMFGTAVDAHAEFKKPPDMIELNTRFTTKLLAGIVIFAYIVVKTPDVLDGHTSLGIFLATISVFGSHLSEAITELNDQLMIIIKGFVPLKELTYFFNLPLELPELKKVNQYRTETNDLKRSALMNNKDIPGQAFKSDQISIEVDNLSFEYGNGVPVLRNVSISVPQGHMVAIVGPHNSGKSTLLNLLSNILIPTSGHIFVPSHLRVVHVSREPLFMHASLLHNLTLGLPRHMIDVSRIKRILKMLDLGDIITLIDKDLNHGGWIAGKSELDSAREHILLEEGSAGDTSFLQSLNHSRKAKLHIARALIANPEVMVLQRAFQPFEDEVACEVLEVVRAHVQERGLCFSEEGRARRRPRSVFFSTESVAQAVQADTIWQMKPNTLTVEHTTADALWSVSTPRKGYTPRKTTGCFPSSPTKSSSPW